MTAFEDKLALGCAQCGLRGSLYSVRAEERSDAADFGTWQTDPLCAVHTVSYSREAQRRGYVNVRTLRLGMAP